MHLGFNGLPRVRRDAHVATLLLGTGKFKNMMDVANKHGKTALHVGAFRATPAFCKMLVDNGATPDVKEKTTKWIANTPAELADNLGKPETANFLRELTVTLAAVRFGSKLKLKTKKNALTDGVETGSPLKSPKKATPRAGASAAADAAKSPRLPALSPRATAAAAAK